MNSAAVSTSYDQQTAGDTGGEAGVAVNDASSHAVRTELQFKQAIAKFVACENQIAAYNKHLKQLRDAKSQLQPQIVQFMERNEITDRKILVPDGELRYVVKTTAGTISLQMLKQALDEFFSADPATAENVFSFVKNARTRKECRELLLTSTKS